MDNNDALLTRRLDRYLKIQELAKKTKINLIILTADFVMIVFSIVETHGNASPDEERSINSLKIRNKKNV